MTERVIWVDPPSGASSGLLLGALVDADVPIGVPAEAIEKVAPGARLLEKRVHADDVLATSCRVEIDDVAEQRTWRDVEALLGGAGLHEDVRSLAHDVFARLAEDESHAQGLPIADVAIHDEGSPHAIAEVVGVCAGVVHLAARRLVVSPGADLARSTPLGTALLTALADDWGSAPAMTVSHSGVGADWDEAERPARLMRLSVGESHPGQPESQDVR
jgi:pyridinium-3,5-bisthiocarboxylic acid mononucleotide nickel chelatase